MVRQLLIFSGRERRPACERAWKEARLFEIQRRVRSTLYQIGLVESVASIGQASRQSCHIRYPLQDLRVVHEKREVGLPRLVSALGRGISKKLCQPASPPGSNRYIVFQPPSLVDFDPDHQLLLAMHRNTRPEIEEVAILPRSLSPLPLCESIQNVCKRCASSCSRVQRAKCWFSFPASFIFESVTG
jgi:hypothetical protein